jgi:superfamily II DNA or RNA helicase
MPDAHTDIIASAAGSAWEKGAKTFYHGSPNADLQTLAAGSYVTPDLDTAKLMGRFYADTGKTWSDDDLAEKHKFGAQPKWKLGREPTGEPAIYKLQAAIKQLNLLDNPYEHTTLESLPVEKHAVDFTPDYTPEQLENLGVYDALYRNQGPRLASLGEWKPEWVSEHDPKGWAQWYKRYSSGRRIPEEDERQINRWSSFKARHGSSFTKNPTPRRGWALRNWGIDPAKLVTNEARNGVVEMLDEYQRKAMQKYVQGLSKQAATPPQPVDMNVGGSVSMPVTPKLPSLATPEMTNQGIKGWMRNNYSGSMSGIGQNRQNFFSQIQDHINPPQTAPGFLGSLFGPKQTPQPNLTPQYTQFLNNKNTELMGRVGVPYETQAPTSGGLLNSGVQMNAVGKRILTLPDNPSNQYVGQGYFTPQNPKDGPPADLYKWGPAMPRSLVGLHERQHLLQELPPQAAQTAAGFKPSDRLLSVMNGTPEGSFMEPAAVMTEMAHAADAAKQVTGKPVPGDMQFSPGYSMPIDEMRREGERAGVLSGRHTAQEALNTPAGQAWLRMQMQQHADAAAMEKRNGAAAASKAWAKQADLLPGIQLQDHQQRISDRVTGENPRMLVYHGLGSGKSLSALAAAEAAQRQYGGNYGIVAPASLRGNFQKEVKKFTTSQPEIMSYTGLGMGKQFKDQPETLVMDEAARLRNPNAASTRAAFQAAQKADRLMLLTGTPITNEPKDLASIISMLTKQEITPEEFEKEYVGYKKVWPGLWGWMHGAKSGVKPIIRNGPKLRSLLEGKVDYQPSKTPEGVNVNEQVIRVPLSPEQQKIQKAVRTKVPPGFLWKMDQEFPLSRQELSKLNSFMTGLRQVGLSTQPFRADRDPLKAFQQSAKMQEAFKNLKSTLDSDPRKKAIIYSNFVDSGLSPYAAGLTQAGVPHAFFHGGVSPKVRQAAVDAYNAGKLRALLIGPAGAEGISTKGTSLIQLMDPHWNEARTQQARGRGLRFDSHAGLPEELKNVAVQRYISSSEDPSMLGKLMGYKRERTGDEVLERLTAEKEKLNEEFRDLLREIGSQHKQNPQLAEKVGQRCVVS